MVAAPKIYFETDHYRGWPAVLARASAVKNDELARCVARAWRLMAPKPTPANKKSDKKVRPRYRPP